MSKHADPADIASEQEQIARQMDIQAVRARVKPQQVKDADGNWPHEDCVECGAPIGERRLEAVGAITCIDCATKHERKGRLHAKH